MATHDEPRPKWLEDEMRELGFVLTAPQDQGPGPEAKPERHPPIDKWWERGEECPH